MPRLADWMVTVSHFVNLASKLHVTTSVRDLPSNHLAVIETKISRVRLRVSPWRREITCCSGQAVCRAAVMRESGRHRNSAVHNGKY